MDWYIQTDDGSKRARGSIFREKKVLSSSWWPPGNKNSQSCWPCLRRFFWLDVGAWNWIAGMETTPITNQLSLTAGQCAQKFHSRFVLIRSLLPSQIPQKLDSTIVMAFSIVWFQDVILAIRDCAFVTSEYPLILSFENHCCRQQQYKMAKYCDEIFGDLLLKEPLPDFPAEPGVPLPSPNHLKRKILIKNKRLRPEVEKVELDQFLRGELKVEESNEEKEDAHATAAVTCRPLDGNSVSGSAPTGGSAQPGSNKGLVLATSSAGGSTSVTKAVSEILPTVTATTYQGSTLNVHPLLSSMVVYTQPMKFQGFEYSDRENMAAKMSSFPETTALGYLRAQALEFVKYNKRQLSRIYPKGSRVDSSNFMPQVIWTLFLGIRFCPSFCTLCVVTTLLVFLEQINHSISIKDLKWNEGPPQDCWS